MAVAVLAARVPRPSLGVPAGVVLALQKYWREEVSTWPPGRREAWLKADNSKEAIIALGSRRVKDLLAGIREMRAELLDRVCGPAWVEAWEATGELPPFYEREPLVRLHASRTVLSKRETSMAGRKPSRRWTSPLAVELEDELDAMNWAEAAAYQFPASPSAVVIRQIGEMRGVEV